MEELRFPDELSPVRPPVDAASQGVEPTASDQKSPEEGAGEPSDADIETKSAQDIWLAECYAGQHRPPWTDSLVKPLLEMLEAESPKERLAAAIVLLPFGKLPQALPVIRQAVVDDAELYESVPAAFKWLRDEERGELFWQLTETAPDESARQMLVSGLSDFRDQTTVSTYWKLLQDDDVSPNVITTVEYGLRQAVFGNEWYDTGEIKPIRRKRLLETLEPRARSGSVVQRLMAITMMKRLNAENWLELVEAIAEDASVAEPLRADAFQLKLGLLDSAGRTELAIQTLGGSDADRHKTALMYLALGNEAPSYLKHTRLDINTDPYSYYESSGDAKIIVPKPPRGLEPDQVRRLVNSQDPETAAYAGYLLALYGDGDGMPALIQYWRDQQGSSSARLVYRAIAAVDDPQYIPLLREIYAGFESTYETREFYWTIRIMNGPEILQFRKQIRDEVGMSNLD